MDESDDVDSFLRAVARAPVRVAAERAPGSRIGAHRIVRRLGAGGMGVVYLARDEVLGRDVAIKEHREGGDVARLEREAIAMAKLAHPNVVAVHGVGAEDDHVFVVMEYVAGTTLRGWMRARHGWREVVAMIRGAAAGLAAAHAAGLVHRDFKPENVLVGADGRPRVADFGLVRSEGPRAAGLGPRPAALGGRSSSDGGITVAGAVMGTPAYMAPEQIAGGVVDARADQFALCVTLYEALCGRRPFAGNAIAELADAIEAGRIRPAPRRVPRWLINICARGLAADPAARWPSIDAMIAAIDRGLRRRRRVVRSAGAAIAIAAVIAIAWAVPRRERASPCAEAARELAAAWTAPARARMRGRIVALVPTHGEPIADRVVESIDDYARELHEVGARVCHAHRVEHQWKDELAQRAETCLEQGRRRLARLVRFPLTTPWSVTSLQGGIGSLPPPRACASPESLPPDNGWSADPVRAELSSAIHAAIDGSANELETPLAERAARLERLARAADALGDDHARAHVLAVQAQIAELAGDLDRAAALAQDAFELGRRTGFLPAAIDSELLLYRIYAVSRDEPERAEPWKLHLLADELRDPRPDTDVYKALSSVAAEHARWDEAIDYAQRGVDKMTRTMGGDTLDYADAVANLATTLDAAGRSEEAIPRFREAIAVLRRTVGDDSPLLVEPWTNFSIALHAVGKSDEALDAAMRALALVERWRGSFDTSTLADAFLNVGAALDQPPLAIAAFETSRALYEQVGGDQRATVALILQDLAFEHHALGDEARARAEIDQALRAYADLGDADRVDPINARLLRGEILATTDCAAALAELPRAIADLRRVAPDRTDWAPAVAAEASCLRGEGRIAEARALLVQARAAAGTMIPAARADLAWELAQLDRDPALAAAARADYAAIGSTDANVKVSEIDRWLARNR